MKNPPTKNYVEKAINILELAREQVVKSVNQAMVFAYYEIGKIIVEEEQGAKKELNIPSKRLVNYQKS